MADEWGSKAMFLHRFEKPEDKLYFAGCVVADSRPDLEGETLQDAILAFRDRQVGRMPLVGCTAANAPVIKENY
jgi:hypothetical protein